MKSIAMLTLLALTLNAHAADITCETNQFKKCALKFLVNSQELKDDVASQLSDDSHTATKKEIADFIQKAYKVGELDLANFGFGDGGDGQNQPAGYIGTIRLGMESHAYQIVLSMTNLVYEKDGRNYGKVWKVDKNSGVERVNLVAEKTMDRKDDLADGLKK